MKTTNARTIAGFVPDCAVLLTRLVRDSRVPRRQKLLLAGLLAYLSLPFDLVPDFIPVVGQLDDAVVIALAVRSLVKAVPRSVVAEHWPGPASSLDALLRFTAAERRASPRSA